MQFFQKIPFLRLALFSLLLPQLCFANIDRSDKRVDFIVDEDIYADAEVLHSIKMFANVAEVKYGTHISIKPFPSAKLFTNDLKANMKRAAQLKDSLKVFDNMRFGTNIIAKRAAATVASEIVKNNVSISGMNRNEVSIHASESSSVEVLVIGANGSVIAKASNVQVSAGTNNIATDLNAIPSGRYIVSVKSSGSASGKVFKLK